MSVKRTVSGSVSGCFVGQSDGYIFKIVPTNVVAFPLRKDLTQGTKIAEKKMAG